MKTLQKLSARFFTERTSKFIFDRNFINSFSPVPEESLESSYPHGHEIFKTHFNLSALKTFTGLQKELVDLIGETKVQILQTLGICTINMNEIRQMENGPDIEQSLLKLQSAVEHHGIT